MVYLKKLNQNFRVAFLDEENDKTRFKKNLLRKKK